MWLPTIVCEMQGRTLVYAIVYSLGATRCIILHLATSESLQHAIGGEDGSLMLCGLTVAFVSLALGQVNLRSFLIIISMPNLTIQHKGLDTLQTLWLPVQGINLPSCLHAIKVGLSTECGIADQVAEQPGLVPEHRDLWAAVRSAGGCVQAGDEPLAGGHN